MQRLIIMVSIAVMAGCRTVPLARRPGSTTPRGAVEQMLTAARAQDLQAIAAIWGDESGLASTRFPREEVESRAFIMVCVLKSDSAKVNDAIPSGGGRVLIPVELTQGQNRGTTRFEAARTKDGTWLVANVDIPALQNKGFCTR